MAQAHGLGERGVLPCWRSHRSECACSSPRGKQVASQCRRSLLGGGGVDEGRPEPSCCGFTGRVETDCLSVPVVDAREGW